MKTGWFEHLKGTKIEPTPADTDIQADF